MFFIATLVILGLFILTLMILVRRNVHQKLDLPILELLRDAPQKLVLSTDEVLDHTQIESLQEKPITLALPITLSYVHKPRSKKTDSFNATTLTKTDQAEDYVNRSLSGLGPRYIIFSNLIVDKSGYVKTAEIDHTIISLYGIFCVETKSHVGSIYGSVAKLVWKQYLHGKEYPFYNPKFQNNNHARVLSRILGEKLKSKVHTYVVFPNADKVKVNSPSVFMNTKDIITAIDAHQTLIYSFQELSDIAYLLAKYTKEYDLRQAKHIKNVGAYMNSIK